MATYATVRDVQKVYEQPIPAGAEDRVERLLDKAEARLLVRVPSIPQRILDGDLDAALVRGVLEDVVLRVIRNPSGFNFEQAGEFAYRVDKLVASGRLEVTDEDIAPLLPRLKKTGPKPIMQGISVWRLP